MESDAVHGCEEPAVVETVSVAVCAVVPLSPKAVVPKLREGGVTALTGPPEIAAARLTLPVNPATGVTVMVDVLPELEPAVTVTFVPVIVKLGPAEADTVTEPVPAALL